MQLTKISPRNRAIIIGVLILAAYSMLASEMTDSTGVIMITDVISGLAVIGIAVLFFSFFTKINTMFTYSYLALKCVEGGLMIAAGLLFLSGSFQHIRAWVYDSVHTYVFIVSGFIFYWLLYKSRIIPRFISIWGFCAISSLALITALKMIDSSNTAFDFLLILIITNEVFLAFWLMVKGFNMKEIDKDNPSSLPVQDPVG